MRSPIVQGCRFDFCSPVRIHYGRGIADMLGDFCAGAKRVLIVTGRRSAHSNGSLARVRNALRGRDVAVFGEVEPNPCVETVERGAELARGADAELIVGLGGGSAMDAAKAISVLASNRAPFRELLGKPEYPNAPVRTIAIPTTCGTGSEANRYAIITNSEGTDKLNFSNRQTYPSVAILDPSMLDGIPADILVGTALDAFTHALEGYTSRHSQPIADVLALEAMSLIVRCLPSAARDEEESRANLLLAAGLAGMVIDQTGTTVLHAMGYYLTLRHGIPHGKANAILLPLLLAHLEEACPARMHNVYSLFPESNRHRNGVRRYLEAMKIDTCLAANGIKESEFEDMAGFVLSKKNTASTRGRIDREALLRLLRDRAK